MIGGVVLGAPLFQEKRPSCSECSPAATSHPTSPAQVNTRPDRWAANQIAPAAMAAYNGWEIAREQD